MIGGMRAFIIAVGTELLGTRRLDTNSLYLTEVLERFGVELLGKSVVGDLEELLAQEVRRRSAECELVLITGGLGPTADDVTRPAVAAALEREIAIDEALVEQIRRRFASFGRRMADSNRRQAERIAGATVLDNARGSAPGMRLDHGRATLFLFPGVPREMRAMVEAHLEPWLAERAAAEAENGVTRGVVKVACVAESDVEERLGPLYRRFGREAISVLASPGEVKVHVSARGAAAERQAKVDEMRRAVLDAVGSAAFVDRDVSLESVVGELLERAGRTVVTAESCTGGLVAERLTRVAGSSAFFLGGVVSYSNELKHRLLGVPLALIDEHGAVSEEVARAMASGARRRLGGDYAVSVTGIAGPGGGSEHKPVGTVHMALAGPGEEVVHRRVRFPGGRGRVRQQTSQMVLDLLRRHLLPSEDRSPRTDEGRPR